MTKQHQSRVNIALVSERAAVLEWALPGAGGGGWVAEGVVIFGCGGGFVRCGLAEGVLYVGVRGGGYAVDDHDSAREGDLPTIHFTHAVYAGSLLN